MALFFCLFSKSSRHYHIPFLICCLFRNGAALTWSNIEPRVNVSGDIMDAHDGSYNQWGGSGTPFYYYAMGYGECMQVSDLCNHTNNCGYGYNWIGVWKSDDLSDRSWTLIQDARDDTWPQYGDGVGSYFRVHVIYNEKTQLYILWVNVDSAPQCPGDNQDIPCYLIGTSSVPEGPFSYVGASNTRFEGPGDFDLFIDDDKQGYIIYTSTSNGHLMSVEKLTDDYLLSVYSSSSSSSSSSQKQLSFISSSSLNKPNDDDGDDGPTDSSSGYFGNAFVEAPVLFKRNNIYYSFFGACCCFCGLGSGIGVYSSTTSPLGPWYYHENIGCSEGEPPEGCGCGMDAGIETCPNLYGTSITQAQQNYIIQIKASSQINNNNNILSKDEEEDDEIQYIWTGDRWQSSSDGIKAHDFQYWFPLNFSNYDVNDHNITIPIPQPIQWIDSFDLDF